MRFVTFLIIVVVAIFGGLYYYGIFSPVNIVESEQGPYILVYDKHVGPYSKIGPVMDNIFNRLKTDGIDSTTGFGLYYDNPDKTPELSLRSIGGCIIGNVDYTTLKKMHETFFVKEITRFKCLKADFPYKGKVSIIMGVFRVYPAIKKYMKLHELPDMPIAEIYDEKGGKITYIIPTGLSHEMLLGLYERAENK